MQTFIKLACILLFTIKVSAQESCYEPSDKKAKKLFEAGTNKKNDKKERLDALKKCLEIDPEYPQANYAYANELIKTAEYEGRSIVIAKKYLETAVAGCNEINHMAHFFLGKIYYSQKEFALAETSLKKFLSDVDKIKKDEDYNAAESLLKQASGFKELYAEKFPFNPLTIPVIDTKDDEYLGILSPDNELMFFTKRYMRKEKDDLFERWIEELSYSEKSKTENFKSPRALPPPFNQGDNYGGACLTADNKEMYITICKPGLNGYNNCDIFRISRRNGMWGELENLGPNINTEDGWESQPSISADGKTLFFATARANSKKMDIFYSTRNADGTWQAAKPVENGINTEGNEKSPFIHSDSQTLYFSSDGHTGLGGFDIFYTRHDEKNQWIKPKNLGIPINTEKDEAGFFVSTDGKTGYFSSNFIKGAGGWDIFQFDLYEKARPQNIVFLKGTVKDPSGAEIKNATVELKNTETKETIEVKVDSLDGKYVAVMAVRKPADLVLTVKEPGKVPQVKLIPKEIEPGKPIKIENEIKPPKKGETYTINDIKYKTNSSELTSESKFILDEFAFYLKSNAKIKIQIQGHTDDVGDDKANLALSSDRAFTVMQYLQNTGIDGKRLSFKGFGETKPVLPNTSDENRAKNRRTEFIILD